MKVQKRNIDKSLLSKLIILGSLLFLLILFIILRNSRDFCEGYSRTIVRAYTFIYGNIASWFPFSFFELFIFGTIAYFVAFIVFFVQRTKKEGIKNSYHMLLRLSIVVMSILVIYQGTAGMEYSRKPVEIPQHTELIANPKDYKEISMKFVNEFNECASKMKFREDGALQAPYGYDVLIEKLKIEFSKFDSEYLSSFTPKAKPLYLTGWFYRAMSISGVTFTPTGEANFNVLDPDGILPFTIAHEMAHIKGAMPEEDANLVAAYICLNSDDPYIRFSGFNETIWSLASLVQATNVKEDLNEFYSKIDARIYANNAYENDYWTKYAVFQKISDWFNDLYLKYNNDNGTISYSDNIDVIHTETEYVVNSYSRYQALYMWLYFDKN